MRRRSRIGIRTPPPFERGVREHDSVASKGIPYSDLNSSMSSSVGISRSVRAMPLGHSTRMQHHQKTALTRLGTGSPLWFLSAATHNCAFHQPRSRPDQRNETAAGFAEPFVRVDDAPVGQAPLVAEIGPEHRPLKEPLSPPFHLAGSLDTEQLLGKRSQLHARLELQPRAGDQHHRVTGHPYPAHEHDVARRVNRVAHRPYVPERRRPPAERPPRPGMSPCESFDSSQETNAARSRAEVSLWWTEDTPQLPQHHLCDPALVLPFLFIADPQDGHLLLSMALLRKTDFLPWFSLHELVIRQYPDTLLSERKSRFLRLFP